MARRLSEASRRLGIEAPGFRSPPRAPGVRRSVRREADGSATISVALRGRPGVAVMADMVDGVLAAAELAGIEAISVRDELWGEVAALVDDEIVARGSLPAKLAA